MPFSRPTLTQLRAQIGADIASSVPGADGLLRFTNLGVLGDLVAKAEHAHFGYLDWIALQSVPFTATGEHLEGWAALKQITRKPAAAAAGFATFAGTPGTVIPAGSAVTRADGFAYTTSADAAVAPSGFASCPILANAPGATGDAAAGVLVSLSSNPIAGVQSDGATGTTLTGGADVEGDDDLRTRMLQAYSAVPQGGAANDYVDWALEVPGVTRAWATPSGVGPGTVVVYVMLDDAEAAFGGFPQGQDGVAAAEPRATAATGDQLTVANAIYPLQPVTALVYVVAPLANPVTLTISLPSATAAIRAAVDAAIGQVFLDRGAPGGTVDLSYIEAAIAAISGSSGFVITAISAPHGSVTPGTTGNIISATGYLPVGQPSVWV
jgi:uncharacterized phage protein gp47/JayE